MELKNLFQNTQRAYLAAVTGLGKHYQQSLERNQKTLLKSKSDKKALFQELAIEKFPL